MTRALVFAAAGIVTTALCLAGCAQNRACCGGGGCPNGACAVSGPVYGDGGSAEVYPQPAEPAPGPIRRMMQGSGMR
ncbi:MAG TPA: hypothetical protein VNH11_31310 [Pirellulales bacterium]|nr:hypothetical protein [Pirellulales bacterium]